MSTETQQPVVMYPNSVPSGQTLPSQIPHSDGSFGTVFIVLAVIIVVSSTACFLGRLCNRRMSQTKPATKQNKKHDPRHKGNDIELGFDGPIRTAKPVGAHGGGADQSKRFKMLGNEDPRGFRSMPGDHGDFKEFKLHPNGDFKGSKIHANGDLKGQSKHVDHGAI
ncbi:hypothetical protein HRI_004492200 [Hibiscus trionum]|uniref:Transmembrane protein n=1 Tax=Hibiscus trionum TaxID=183268 RepID=A0A9W7MQW8_HIBTR|nr:hypothetical protein HRI_004492200 [Hibiscus trionum]